MKYKITIRVDSLDIPESENIPEVLEAQFETDDKLDGIQQVLAATARGWGEFQKMAQKT